MAQAPAPRSLNPMAQAPAPQGTIGFNEGGAIEDGMLFVDDRSEIMDPAMMDPRRAQRDARRDARDQRLAGILSLKKDSRDAQRQANRQSAQMASDARNRARLSSRIGSMENILNNYGSADEYYQGKLERQRTGFGSTLPDSYFANPANRYNTYLNSAEGEAQAKQAFNQAPQELDRLRSVYDRLPSLPMNTAVASSPMNPMAQSSKGQRPVIKLAEGGEPFRPRFQGDVPATAEMDITIEPLKFIQDMDKKTGGAVTEQFGSVEEAAKEGTRKTSIIESATEATKDPSKIADAVLVASGEQPTEAAKMDFAENVFGLEDVNDIDEINRRIANVAIGGSVAKSPEEFTQAVLLGLQAYKQTATARAAAAAGGGTTGFTKDRTALRAYQDTLDSLTRSLSDRDLPEGYTGSVADYAAEQALKQVMRTYPIDQIPPQLLGQGGGQPQVQPQVSDDGRITMYDPTGKPFYSTDGTNFVDADGNPYAPPTQE